MDDENLIVWMGAKGATYIAGINVYVTATSSGVGFEFENGTLMIGNDYVHTTGFNIGAYYIKCKDVFDRSPGSDCSIVVSGGLLWVIAMIINI